MLKSLSIENFRCFKTFDLNPLGRINLLVGANNSGKTSIIEAIQVLCAGQDFTPLKNIMMQRGDVNEESETLDLDPRYLFHNYEMHDQSSICLKGLSHSDQSLELSITFLERAVSPLHTMDVNDVQTLKKIVETLEGSKDTNKEASSSLAGVDILGIFNEVVQHANPELLTERFGDGLDIPQMLKVRGNTTFSLDTKSPKKNEFNYSIHFAENGGLNLSSYSNLKEKPLLKILFISLPNLELADMLLYFEEIVLEPEEDVIQEALRIIEPDLERIAIANRRKFFAKFSGQPLKVPLGNLGEGARYLLGLVLALVQVPNGILLVDDIDTGLHYSALTEMWQLVWETAKRLNIQVFATTHNSDCWQSLADIAEQDDVGETDITIHRIEKGLERSVYYTAPKIVIAADRELEVR